MLNPNFAIMCTPGASEDSFDNTEPFGFNSATYFLPMCTLIGVAFASTFIGTWSDRVGRKRVLLILAWVSAAGSIIKYFTKNTFWGFCASNFAFGFFLGNLPVGMAYIGDIESRKKKKDEMLGVLGTSIDLFVLNSLIRAISNIAMKSAALYVGTLGGGIIAVLMNDTGLFSPLWVGAGLMVISAVTAHAYMIEAGDKRIDANVDEKIELKGYDEEAEDVKRPEAIDRKTMWNIVGGALLDNIGSTGLFPLCLSSLALEQYYVQYVAAEEEPIMTITAYQGISVCVALLVVPSTRMTPFVFNRIGVAGTCVFGNSCTAGVTGLLLLIGNMPASEAAFGAFVFVLYAGFPFTVFSQLTTGPMLDVITPADKIGYIQGLNNSSMNLGMAISPWVFGLLAVPIGIGFSILAALANAPLMWHKQLNKQMPTPHTAKHRLKGEDKDLIRQILDGEYVDPELMFKMNRDRSVSVKPSLVPRVKTYDEDKMHLEELKKEASATFKFRMELYDRVLAGLESAREDPDNCEFTKSELVSMLNATKNMDKEIVHQAQRDLGLRMGQYLEQNGYNPHLMSVMMKQMFIASFPPLSSDPEFTEENVEEYLLKGRRVMSRYVDQEVDVRSSVTKMLGTFPPIFYS
eukprot:scaffold15044_cov193-Alexandrium_tamarense.AAC.2